MSPNGAIASQQVEDQQRITALDQVILCLIILYLTYKLIDAYHVS